MMENGTGTPVVMNTGDSMGSNWVWAFLLFAMLGGGFGGGNNYHPQYATQDFVQNGFNFNDLQDQNRDILGAITNGTAQSVAAVNQNFHDLANVVNDKYFELQRDVAGLAVGQSNLQAKQQECCCSTLRAIDGVNYNNAMNTASINANTTAQTQKILDALNQNKIEALQGRINQLELAQATQGVVRYPNGWTYNAGTSPFCNNGCGCGLN